MCHHAVVIVIATNELFIKIISSTDVIHDPYDVLHTLIHAQLLTIKLVRYRILRHLEE